MDCAFVDLVVAGVELGEAGGASDHQRQDTSRHRIESAEVAYFFGSSKPADLVDDVMRGPAGGLIDDYCSIHLVTVTGGVGALVKEKGDRPLCPLSVGYRKLGAC